MKKGILLHLLFDVISIFDYDKITLDLSRQHQDSLFITLEFYAATLWLLYAIIEPSCHE